MTQHNRRSFLNSTFIAASGVGMTAGMASSAPPTVAPPTVAQPTADQKTVDRQTKRIPKAKKEWPIWDETEESALVNVLNSGTWGRTSGGPRCAEFEAAFAKRQQAKYCVLTSSGTTALLTAIGALDIGPGDEVILPPYTFVASFNVITNSYALPVFVDTDLNTFQIDPTKIESAVTPATRLVLPVHIGGYSADMDAINTIAKKHSLSVIEDACQAHMGEWRGRKLGTHGAAGCFSFQASKNLNSGEGGAVSTNDTSLFDRCYSFHTNGRNRMTGGREFVASGANLRLTEFQASILRSQMTRVEAQAQTRNDNAKYLTSLLEQIPGIKPVRNYAGCTRSAWHLYMLRYDKSAFADVPRSTFLKALAAEGIRGSSGYTPLNKQPFIKETVLSKGYRKIYPEKLLTEWYDRNQCAVNDRLCEEAVWFTQTALLGPRSDMEQIAGAIAKIQAQAGQLRTV